MDIALADAPSPSVLAAVLGGMAEPSGRDRRVHERLGAHDLDWLKSARLRFGPVLSLIDLSAGGAQFETSAPLRPGSNAVLTISGRGVTETASFRVLRCEVASVQQQGLVYRGACVFDRMIQIPGTASQGSVTVREDTASLDEVVKLVRSLAARNADPARMGRVMSEIRTAVERGESPDAVLHFVERELAGPVVAPARIGTAPRANRSVPKPAAEAMVVRRSAPAASRPAPVPARAAAAAPTAPVAPAAAPTAPSAMAHPGGTHATAGSKWNKLVVRYLDGTLLKGFSQDFHATRSFFHLTPSITPGAETSMVPMQQLKAVFFVRDFEGDPNYVEAQTFADRPSGRKIEITFADGEQMVGSTLGYRTDGAGFFVSPADGDGNNLRVFVLPGGVKRVRYL
jgi:hypothetical protein